jgi:membrane-associated phospholipid phosphatase
LPIVRRIRTLHFAALVSLAAPLPVTGQGGLTDRSARGDFEFAGRDVLYVWSAPVHGKDSDWLTALLVGAMTGATMGVDDRAQEWVHAHAEEFPLRLLALFGEGSPMNLYGRTKLLVPLSSLLYLGGVVFERPGLRDAGMGCITANLANTLSRHALARVIGRARPQERRGAAAYRVPNFAGSWEMRSFPGGHAANAMACTTFWARRFDLGPAEPALFTFAIAIGAARWREGAHWLSDTLFGMGWGIAVGKAVAERYRGRAADDPSASGMPSMVLVWRLAM